MKNPTQYWYVNCPVCEQGRLFVAVRDETKELFLECEECSTGWKNPEQVSANENGFLAIHIMSHFATTEEIQKGGWSKYQFNAQAD